MWNAGCGFWDKGILTKAAYAKFNENMRDEFDIEGRDVKFKFARPLSLRSKSSSNVNSFVCEFSLP